MKATAIAHPNIALVKYWGKRDAELNLPATGSLSWTFGPMRTRTFVEWTSGGVDAGTSADRIRFDGEVATGRDAARIARFLDMVRSRRPELGAATVVTDNDFPTAAGLASSAAGFAALALAATSAAGLNLEPHELSVLARRGSGSAARSLSGGFVRMHRGENPDGSDAYAEQIFGADHWPLRMLVALTTTGRKAVSSTVGMNRTVDTSPYFDAWTREVPLQLEAATRAIEARDFEAVAAVAEHSACAMHASALAARPAVIYWKPATLAVMHLVTELRAAGTPAFFTIDAGPHVKVITAPDAAELVESALRDIDGVVDVIPAGPGGDAQLVT